MPRLASKRPLTTQEQTDLLYLIEEAKSRGIALPEVKLAIQDQRKVEWPVASNGYFLKRDGKLYEPSDSQAGFIHSTSPFALYYGSRGSGKSGAGSQKALNKIEDGWSGAVINPDFENFRYSTWPEFKEWIPWKMVVPSQRHRSSDAWQPSQPFTMVFMNGARVYCKGLKDPNSARGPNLNWLWYDEGDETRQDSVGVLLLLLCVWGIIHRHGLLLLQSPWNIGCIVSSSSRKFHRKQWRSFAKSSEVIES